MKRSLFLFLLLCLSTMCNGQISVHYYLEAGDVIARNHWLDIIRIKGHELESGGSIEVTDMADRVKTNGRVQFNNSQKRWNNSFEPFTYNASLSNSKMDVYRRKWTKWTPGGMWGTTEDLGYYYIAVSKDKRRMVSWKEAHGSDEIIDKQEYSEVTIDDVINGLNPQPSNHVNRDFLYE